jgi:hypothetical protein
MKTYSTILMRPIKKRMEHPTSGIRLTIAQVRKKPRLGIRTLVMKMMVLQVYKAVILMMLERKRSGISRSMRNMT